MNRLQEAITAFKKKPTNSGATPPPDDEPGSGPKRTIVSLTATFACTRQELLDAYNEWADHEGQDPDTGLDPENIMYVAMTDEGWLPMVAGSLKGTINGKKA